MMSPMFLIIRVTIIKDGNSSQVRYPWCVDGRGRDIRISYLRGTSPQSSLDTRRVSVRPKVFDRESLRLGWKVVALTPGVLETVPLLLVPPCLNTEFERTFILKEGNLYRPSSLRRKKIRTVLLL